MTHENLLSIGKIVNFHGINGEAKVGYTTGNEDLLKNLKHVFVQNNSELIKLEIETLRFHKNNALIKFKEINSLNDIIPFKNCILKAEKENFSRNLQEDEFLINDLVNMQVYDQNQKLLGIVISIDETPASSILIIKTEAQKTAMIPFVKAIVSNVNLVDKKITINNIEGLIE